MSWNMCESCVTTPTERRSDSNEASRTSVPPMRTLPPVTSYSRATSAVIVVLPAPEGPTRATLLPAGATKSMPSSTVDPPWLSTTPSCSSDCTDTCSAVG